MRFVGNRRKQWSGYIILALTIGLAWLTRNRPPYRSRFPYEANTRSYGTPGSAAGQARVYDAGRARAAATATAATAGAARVYDRAEDPSPYLTRRLDPAEVDHYRHRRRALWWLIPLLLIPLLMCIVAWLVARNGGIDNTPSNAPAAIQVDPQRATGSSVTLKRVVAPQNSWVALYRTNAHGQPDLNATLGTVPVGAGESTDVNVPINQPVASGEQVAAVLLADNGAPGTFEPNGADTPLPLDDGSTATTFALGAAGALAAAAQASSSPSQPQTASGSAQASASGMQADGGGASAAASASTAAGTNGSVAPSAGVVAGQGTSTDQLATADATTTATADTVGAAASAAGAATGGSDLPSTVDATAATGVIDATPDTSDALAAAGAALNDTATAAALEATPDDATASAETATASALASDTTPPIDTTPDATTAATGDAAGAEVATAAASDTALASGAAAADTITPGSTAAALNVDPNQASIVAAQQREGGDSVTLDRVVAPTDGWVAVYRRNADGTPNYDDLLGSAPVQQGENTDVRVPLTEALSTDDAVVVLHTDAGTIGTFDDSNSVDLPVTANGALVAVTIAASDDAATGTDQPTAASDQTGAASDQTAAPSASEPVAQQTTETSPTASTAAASAATNNSTAPIVAAAPTATTAPIATSTPTATAAPTATAQQTATATPTATAAPTETAAPTNTVEPTHTPPASAAPTATPTMTATSAPTTAPTIAPATTVPTVLSTEAPATTNTATPTLAPTAASVVTPTPVASAAPSTASAATGGATASASSSPNVAAGASASPSPQGVVVNNAVVSGSTTLLDQVTIAQNGWAVLSRADANGQPVPNAIVGVVPVQAGVSTGVQAPLNGTLANGDKIVVVLHADAGTLGTFEYPNGPDTPLAVTPAAPVLVVQAPEQLPETGVVARAWTALAAAFVLCAAGLALRRYPVR